MAASVFSQRLKTTKTRRRRQPLRSLSLYRGLVNVGLHASAHFRGSFRWRFFWSELSKTCSYVVMLSGAFWIRLASSSRLRSMAITDHSGVVELRRLISVLEAELTVAPHAAPIQRGASRLGRPKIITISMTSDRQPLAGAYRQDSAQPFPRDRHGRAIGGDEFAVYCRKPARTSRRVLSLESASVSLLNQSACAFC